MLRRTAVLALAVVPGLLAFAQVARAQGDAPAAAPPPAPAAPPAAPAPAPTPAPAPAPAPAPSAKPTLIPPEVDEKQDEKSLKAPEGTPTATATVGGAPKASSGEIVSDDWWTHTRPLIEIHGFFRTRAEVFHNFSLGRVDPIGKEQGLFPRPADDSWTDYGGTTHFTGGCGPTPSGPADNPTTINCENKTHASANLRFRVDPEIHISDNLRIISQIDFLDNLVLGSTPEGYVNEPGKGGQYNNPGRSGYVPLHAFSTTQVPPTAGVNSYQNSIAVKRVWAEYATPIGQLRFGRMPSHWGLGILVNSGDKIDSDYQTTADRILFVTGSRALDVYIAGAWDFPNSGKTSQTVYDQQGQPYNISQLENTNQWVLTAFRRVRPEILKQKLARGEVVVNGGAYVVYRQQLLANETSAGAGATSNASSSLSATQETYKTGLTRVGAKAWIPDFWLQILTKNLRWETEAVYLYGSIENPVLVGTNTYGNFDYKIRQLGIATELEYKALNDDLKLRFYSGFASGDQGVDAISPGQGLQQRLAGDNTISTFRFNPDYRIDLILFRNILTRVQGVYYFKPGVEYDFTKSLDGEKFGGRAEIIYSRASVPVQAPGNKADLGIELDLSLYYQSKDGTLNNDPSKIGGFYGMLQYGVLFPLGGLGYPEGQPSTTGLPDISSAQIVRLFLGVAY